MRHQQKNHLCHRLLQGLEQCILCLGRHLLHRLDQHHTPPIAKGMLVCFLNHLSHTVHADLLTIIRKKGQHVRLIAIQHAAAGFTVAAGLVFGRAKQGAGQRPGKGPLAKASRARQQICMHHLPVEKLVHHYADARVEALVKGEHGRRRSGYNLCQCGSFPGVTA